MATPATKAATGQAPKERSKPAPRSPAQLTAALLLRGALIGQLSRKSWTDPNNQDRLAYAALGFRSLHASKSEGEKETLSLVLPDEPSYAPIKATFAYVNQLLKSTDDMTVVVSDLPLEAFASSGLGYEFAKYEPKPGSTKVRVAQIKNLAMSAIAHDGSEAMPLPSYAVDPRAVIAELDFVDMKWKKASKTFELQYKVILADGAASAALCSPVAPEQCDLAWTKVATTSQESGADGGSGEKEQVITPWDVDAEGGVDYERLLRLFGCDKITPELLERFKRVTKHEPHPWLKRGLFYANRDLAALLDAKERGEPIYLYTGRGPSSESLHFGHLIPFMFTKWLQDVFDAPLVIQLTDDEKFLWKDLTLDETQRLGYENAKDIMAVGFNPKKTFMFLNTEYMGQLYPTVCEIQKRVTFNWAKGIFGFQGSDCIGKIAFPAIQAAPSFSRCFPVVLGGHRDMQCLIPCAIDQDPYFRMTREVAPKLGLKKPALIHAKFFPALEGAKNKMSSSSDSAVMVTDDRKAIQKKIKEKAFSGGRDTKQEQIEKGADLDLDIPYQWLNFFLMDDAALADVARKYGPGVLPEGESRMMTSDVKAILVEVLDKMATDHQTRRAALTTEVMNEVFAVRSLV